MKLGSLDLGSIINPFAAGGLFRQNTFIWKKWKKAGNPGTLVLIW